ncbi:NlpC/P60 family protein [Streptomyces sp. NPDC002643]
MSGRLLRLVCTATVTTAVFLSPTTALAAPQPPDPDPARIAPPPDAPSPSSPIPDARPLSALLTDLQRLYRETEEATEAYNATEEKLRKQRTVVARLDKRLAQARLSLLDSRGAAGRLARQQYQNSTTELSPYVRLLLARDPHTALRQGRLIGQVARERAETVARMTGTEEATNALARRARAALDRQLTLTEHRKRDRDTVRDRLTEVERLLASLTAGQLARIEKLERDTAAKAQRSLVASGALSTDRPPSRAGAAAVRYAMAQLGKPYEWGAEGPKSYDCSGLTSRAWTKAGVPIPRTSQQQWTRLPRVPLSQLRPGDLIVYFKKATHIALYVGDGKVIQAPRPGTKVKISPMAANPILGAVRPDAEAKPLENYTPPDLL